MLYPRSKRFDKHQYHEYSMNRIVMGNAHKQKPIQFAVWLFINLAAVKMGKTQRLRDSDALGVKINYKNLMIHVSPALTMEMVCEKFDVILTKCMNINSGSHPWLRILQDMLI